MELGRSCLIESRDQFKHGGHLTLLKKILSDYFISFFNCDGPHAFEYEESLAFPFMNLIIFFINLIYLNEVLNSKLRKCVGLVGGFMSIHHLAF